MKRLTKILLFFFVIITMYNLNCSKNASDNTFNGGNIIGTWLVSYQIQGDFTYDDSSAFTITYINNGTWNSNQPAFYFRMNGDWEISGDTIVHSEDGYPNADTLVYSSFLYSTDDTSMVWIDYQEIQRHEYHFDRIG